MERYQDYVIKDGKFIGKFEEMYRKFDDPWKQSGAAHNENSYARNFAVLNIRRLGIPSIVEFGCGLGYYTDMLKCLTGARVKGVDISATAIEKAKKLWPQLDFAVDRIQNIKQYADFDAVLFAEITWYILDDLDAIFGDMLKYLHGKYFLHNLVFYKGQQRYGTKFFTNLGEFINYVPFQLVGYAEAATVDDDSIETSTIFKIVPKV